MTKQIRGTGCTVRGGGRYGPAPMTRQGKPKTTTPEVVAANKARHDQWLNRYK